MTATARLAAHGRPAPGPEDVLPVQAKGRPGLFKHDNEGDPTKGSTMKAITTMILAIVMAGATSAASAQQSAPAGHGAHDAPAAPTAAAALELTDGEVKKVDKDAGKITLRHGDIRNLDMPGMTMVFRVLSAAMLDLVEAGDRVRFAADRVNGAVTIVRMEKAQ